MTLKPSDQEVVPESPLYPHLAQPSQLGALAPLSRVYMASLTRNRSTGTLPNDFNVEYYAQRAGATGASLIISEGIYIEDMGSEWPNAPLLKDRDHAEAWEPVVAAVHEKQSLMVAQLMHIGRVGCNDMPQQQKTGKCIVGPSAIPARGATKYRTLSNSPGNSIPVPIKEPQEIFDLFENAANMAKVAGFDGVELHGANGYLIDQFLSDVSNQRTDMWGGSVENRCRLALGVVERLCRVYGADRVGIKLSPCGGYNDMFFTSREENIETFRHLISELDKLGLAYVQLSQYNEYGDPKIGGTAQGFDHDVVETYADCLSKVKLIVNTGYDAPKAEEAVLAGKVEGVAFGRAFIGNPDYASRIQRGLSVRTDLNTQAFYQIIDGDITVGYTDYSAAN